MNRIQSLLVAVDFSGDARSAALRAALLAAEQRAKLELLHVMSGRSLNSLRELFRSSDAEADLLEDARRMLKELAEEIAGKTRVTATSLVTIGNVLDEILSASASSALACRALVDLALARGGRDNITVVVGRVPTTNP